MFDKKVNKTKAILAMVFALSAASFFQIDAHAEYVNDSANGVSYYDDESVSVKYCAEYANGGGGYTYISLSNQGDRIANVKSSSSNLIAKKTYESYYISTSRNMDSEWDEQLQDYVYKEKTETSERYDYTYISYFAKKAGTYKVTFDVVMPDGGVRCTKTVKVTATGSSVNTSPVKSIKYDGKELYNYYPFTTKTSGKLSVQMNSKYKLVKIEIGKRNSKGEYDYKTTKNGKKITLAKSARYTDKNSWSETKYDPLFPHTEIRITYQDKKTKEKSTYTTSLSTICK